MSTRFRHRTGLFMAGVCFCYFLLCQGAARSFQYLMARLLRGTSGGAEDYISFVGKFILAWGWAFECRGDLTLVKRGSVDLRPTAIASPLHDRGNLFLGARADHARIVVTQVLMFFPLRDFTSWECVSAPLLLGVGRARQRRALKSNSLSRFLLPWRIPLGCFESIPGFTLGCSHPHRLKIRGESVRVQHVHELPPSPRNAAGKSNVMPQIQILTILALFRERFATRSFRPKRSAKSAESAHASIGRHVS